MTHRIKHIGKTLPLIDPLKVAKALGADTVITGQKQTKNGQNYIEIFSITKNNRRIKRIIYELDKNSAKKYTLLGTAEGMDFFHCIYLAGTHAKNFRKRVYGYCLEESCSPGCNFAISFYAKK